MNRALVACITTLCLVTILAVGCASIIGKGGPQTLNVRSNPDQADISISDEGGASIFSGKTPTTVSLEKKRGYFKGKKYMVKIAKPGFVAQTVVVDTRANGWYIGGNLIFGGLIGWLIVDPLTGAMWTLDTKEVNVALEPSTQTGGAGQLDLKVVLLQDVPVSLRTNMIRVSP